MHVAVVCPELHGHLNPMTTLARELVRRGHTVTLVGTPLAEARAAKAGIGFSPIGLPEHESGAAASQLATLGNLTGFAALRYTGQLLKEQAIIGLRDLPAALKQIGADAVLVDQVSPAGVAVAEVAGLPFVVACNALAMHQEAGVPPGTLAWPYRPGILGRLRNTLGNQLLRFAARPIYRVVNDYRTAHKCDIIDMGTRHGYGLAQVAQQPAFFDYPRERLPEHFHYTGPWHEPGRDHGADFPWNQLDGRPLLYASLGTLQNGLKHVFQAILDGCSPLDVQVVMALGRPDAVWDGPTPNGALVVPFAPQLELLDKASVVVTHAGLNTVLESLARGKPMLCVPVTNDQPGVAGRVAYLGAGEMLPSSRATAPSVNAAVRRILGEDKYRKAAVGCAAKMAAAGPGVRLAGDIVEEAFLTRKRILRAPANAGIGSATNSNPVAAPLGIG